MFFSLYAIYVAINIEKLGNAEKSYCLKSTHLYMVEHTFWKIRDFKRSFQTFALEIPSRELPVAQLVKHPTLDFGSGHGLMVCGIQPASGSTLSVEPA